MENRRIFAGELIGSFVMCFLGIGACASITLFSALTGPGQVGLVWGLGVTLGIYCARNLSGAHLNPAISIAMVVAGQMKAKKLPVYIVGQFIGAFLAAAAVWVLVKSTVNASLGDTGIASAAGNATTIWCQVYPNLGVGVVTTFEGACAEGFAIFMLCSVIFALTYDKNKGAVDGNMAPLFIGLTVMTLATVVAPLTNANFIPTRDLSSRLWGAIVGWGDIAFGTDVFGTLLVYTVAPIIGGVLAALLFRFVIAPLHDSTVKEVED